VEASLSTEVNFEKNADFLKKTKKKQRFSKKKKKMQTFLKKR